MPLLKRFHFIGNIEHEIANQLNLYPNLEVRSRYPSGRDIRSDKVVMARINNVKPNRDWTIKRYIDNLKLPRLIGSVEIYCKASHEVIDRKTKLKNISETLKYRSGSLAAESS
jgi:hypothetical protein